MSCTATESMEPKITTANSTWASLASLRQTVRLPEVIDVQNLVSVSVDNSCLLATVDTILKALAQQAQFMENLHKEYSNHRTETQVILRNFGEEVDRRIMKEVANVHARNTRMVEALDNMKSELEIQGGAMAKRVDTLGAQVAEDFSGLKGEVNASSQELQKQMTSLQEFVSTNAADAKASLQSAREEIMGSVCDNQKKVSLNNYDVVLLYNLFGINRDAAHKARTEESQTQYLHATPTFQVLLQESTGLRDSFKEVVERLNVHDVKIDSKATRVAMEAEIKSLRKERKEGEQCVRQNASERENAIIEHVQQVRQALEQKADRADLSPLLLATTTSVGNVKSEFEVQVADIRKKLTEGLAKIDDAELHILEKHSQNTTNQDNKAALWASQLEGMVTELTNDLSMTKKKFALDLDGLQQTTTIVEKRTALLQRRFEEKLRVVSGTQSDALPAPAPLLPPKAMPSQRRDSSTSPSGPAPALSWGSEEQATSAPQSYKRIGSTKSAFTFKATSNANIATDTEPASPEWEAVEPEDEIGFLQTNETVHQLQARVDELEDKLSRIDLKYQTAEEDEAQPIKDEGPPVSPWQRPATRVALKQQMQLLQQVQRRRQLTVAQKQELYMLEQRKTELSVQEKQVLDLFKQVEQKSALTGAQLQQLHAFQRQLREEQSLALATRPSPPEFDKETQKAQANQLQALQAATYQLQEQSQQLQKQLVELQRQGSARTSHEGASAIRSRVDEEIAHLTAAVTDLQAAFMKLPSGHVARPPDSEAPTAGTATATQSSAVTADRLETPSQYKLDTPFTEQTDSATTLRFRCLSCNRDSGPFVERPDRKPGNQKEFPPSVVYAQNKVSRSTTPPPERRQLVSTPPATALQTPAQLGPARRKLVDYYDWLALRTQEQQSNRPAAVPRPPGMAMEFASPVVSAVGRDGRFYGNISDRPFETERRISGISPQDIPVTSAAEIHPAPAQADQVLLPAPAEEGDAAKQGGSQVGLAPNTRPLSASRPNSAPVRRTAPNHSSPIPRKLLARK
uniref:Uncharacterized protein n=1 Tax=Eutreptiella gymnastica TaxID=73025 RepID=A0A7S1IA29_9EUGL|mmetsp:Transcript_141012/g.245774  ORF Transcript_141012/g.245774 Transcript_141012/m.245774 type:complete len:1029 (+) Transcript_141012:60-3146(+)